MKKMKLTSAFLALVLVASMMFAAIPEGEAIAGPPTDAYNKLLKNLKGTYKVPYYDGYKTNFVVKGTPKAKKKKVSLDYFKYYMIKDINNDGVNDLLLSKYKSTTGRGKILVITYKNHKVVPVFYAKGIREGLFMASNNRVCFKFGGSSEKYAVFMKLNHDKLRMDFDSTYSKVRKSNGKYKYLNGKKKIKKKAYKKELKKCSTNLKDFKKIK